LLFKIFIILSEKGERKMGYLVIFTIDQQQFAFDLSIVERVIPSVEPLSINSSKEYIMGVINLHGDLIPLVNLRAIWEFPQREISLSDKFLICRDEDALVSLWVDCVEGIKEYDETEISSLPEIYPRMDALTRVVKNEGKIILMYQISKLLQLEDYRKQKTKV
jgi:purine-binding chemotaxis protein CheW